MQTLNKNIKCNTASTCWNTLVFVAENTIVCVLADQNEFLLVSKKEKKSFYLFWWESKQTETKFSSNQKLLFTSKYDYIDILSQHPHFTF